MTGRVADTVPLLTQAMKQVTAAERVDLQALCGLSLGEVQVLAGRLEEALTLAELALALARDHQERGHQAYALRLFGDIAARRKPPQSALAEAYYQQALTPEQARTELSAAIALYRVMDMTFWLPQAKAALVQVA
jgi:tetratricopeptide (TPR) repeat protein